MFPTAIKNEKNAFAERILLDPESYDKHGYSSGFEVFCHIVTGFITYIGCKAYEDDGDRNAGSTGGDVWTATAKGRLTTVAVVADDGLNQHARNWAAEPDVSGPFVGDAEELNVRGEQGEL
ncbi:hypothetical protein AgCh_014375 [Apium graveolens]